MIGLKIMISDIINHIENIVLINLITMQPSNINSLQISLLRLFNRPITEEEILILKRALVKHYSILLRQNIQDLEQDKAFDDQNFEDMLSAKS